jgi:hypothetical protein
MDHQIESASSTVKTNSEILYKFKRRNEQTISQNDLPQSTEYSDPRFDPAQSVDQYLQVLDGSRGKFEVPMELPRTTPGMFQAPFLDIVEH